MIRLKTFVLSAVILVVFFIPAYQNFFTNDDFLHLLISRPQNIISLFRIYPHFRPITTQLYYSVSQSPQILHLISLIILIIISFQVKQLVVKIGLSQKISDTAWIMYLLSSTHYAHLNYSGAFHELGYTFFIMAACLTLWSKFWLSPLYFLMALLSKESAVIYPFILILLLISGNLIPLNIPKFKFVISHFAILAIYLLFRFYFFGFASGDTYDWQFSSKIFNTAFWYGLWALNIPEMWVDFVGPKFHINPNLFKFWFPETIAISGLFIIQSLYIVRQFPKFKFLVFGIAWFVISLGPLLLLPWHKFSFYLTLPLVGVVIILSQIKSKMFLITLILLSITTYNLALRTNWISRGAETAKRFHQFTRNQKNLLTNKTIIFYDTDEDGELPWSPTKVLKDTLSDNNYFRNFFPSVSAVYLDRKPGKTGPDQYPVYSRQFLGY